MIAAELKESPEIKGRDKMSRLDIMSWEDVKIVDTRTIKVNGTALGLDDKSEDQLLRQAGVPAIFYKKNPENLKRKILEYHLGEHSNVNRAIYAIDDKVVALANHRKPYVSYTQVIDVLSQILPDAQVKGFELEDNGNKMYMQLTTPSVITEPAVGDITEAGLGVYFSDVGLRSPSIEMYANRLMCSNGMIVEQKEGRWGLISNTVDDIIQELEERAREAFGLVEQKLLHPYSALVEQPVEDVKFMVARLANIYKLPASLISELTIQAEKLPQPCTMYEIQNLFTALANEVSLNSQQRHRLQITGGKIALDSEHRCPACASEL